MKRIEFNSERALAGDKLITRDGRAVSGFKANDNPDTLNVFPFKAFLESDSLGLNTFTLKGSFYSNNTMVSVDDLFMAAVEEWVLEVGEWVEAYHPIGGWSNRQYCFEFKGLPYCAVNKMTKPADFTVTEYEKIRKLPVIKLIITADGKEVDPMKLSNEQIKIINKNYFNE